MSLPVRWQKMALLLLPCVSAGTMGATANMPLLTGSSFYTAL